LEQNLKAEKAQADIFRRHIEDNVPIQQRVADALETIPQTVANEVFQHESAVAKLFAPLGTIQSK
jgi:hypothetical protein